MTEQRQNLKSQRAALDHESRDQAALLIADQIAKFPAVVRAKNIAVYHAVRGEIDCAPLTNKPILRKKRIFLPVLKKNRLKFAAVNESSNWTFNRFGILEPVYTNCDIVPGQLLDIIVVPLVAFDANCNRIGMGGGFYDRTLAFRKRRGKWCKPLLIGVAYSFQRIDNIQPQPWDVPLDCVVTEKECFGSC
ncbi:MAG: 5-formyltetrahydrofolate cyclo-ligase [Gammaproteobacteria bacterium]